MMWRMPSWQNVLPSRTDFEHQTCVDGCHVGYSPHWKFWSRCTRMPHSIGQDFRLLNCLRYLTRIYNRSINEYVSLDTSEGKHSHGGVAFIFHVLYRRNKEKQQQQGLPAQGHSVDSTVTLEEGAPRGLDFSCKQYWSNTCEDVCFSSIVVACRLAA